MRCCCRRRRSKCSAVPTRECVQLCSACSVHSCAAHAHAGVAVSVRIGGSECAPPPRPSALVEGSEVSERDTAVAGSRASPFGYGWRIRPPTQRQIDLKLVCLPLNISPSVIIPPPAAAAIPLSPYSPSPHRPIIPIPCPALPIGGAAPMRVCIFLGGTTPELFALNTRRLVRGCAGAGRAHVRAALGLHLVGAASARRMRHGSVRRGRRCYRGVIYRR